MDAEIRLENNRELRVIVGSITSGFVSIVMASR